MKKGSLFVLLAFATAVILGLGCRSSASSCFTKNGSRVPSQACQSSLAAPTVAAPVYQPEQIIYTSAAGQCDPCTPAACTPATCAPNACDPCGATQTGARTVLPGL